MLNNMQTKTLFVISDRRLPFGASLVAQLVKGLIPGLARSPREGKGYPVQYSGLENSMDYTVTKSWT